MDNNGGHDGGYKDLSASERPLFNKTCTLLRENKLEVTKKWLARLIAQIEDLGTLESFPTQESIRTSADLIEGLATILQDNGAIDDFRPGGKYYQRASSLGTVASDHPSAVPALMDSLLALEQSIWQLLSDALRKEDRELIALVMSLRTGMQGIATACLEGYHQHSSTELDKLAHTDVLTGLRNRRYLIQELERHVELHKRYNHPFALLMLDLDNLKWLNDTHGHQAGDTALNHLATLMRACIRDVDIACRYGGDEFMILMPETPKEQVRLVGRRISDALQKTKLKVEGSLVALTVSVGSAACPDDGVEIEQLLQESDSTLYQSKHGHVRNPTPRCTTMCGESRAKDARSPAPDLHISTRCKLRERKSGRAQAPAPLHLLLSSATLLALPKIWPGGLQATDLDPMTIQSAPDSCSASLLHDSARTGLGYDM